MSIFIVTRYKFLDRSLDSAQLLAFAEMLCQWSALRAGHALACGCEAIVYSLPRQQIGPVREAIAGKLQGVIFDESDPDQLRIIGISSSTTEPLNIGLWLTALAEELIQNACVLLRFTIHGEFRTFKGQISPGRTTIVLCGSPAAGGLIAKAIWNLGQDESFQLVYRSAASRLEPLLIEAFDVYLGNREKNPHDAGRYSLNVLGKEAKSLFVSARDESKIMALTRHMAELPDDRSPRAFARRVGKPLLIAVACSALAPALWHVWSLATVGLAIAGLSSFGSALRMMWKKAGRVRAYHKRMRAGLGKLYSGPVAFTLHETPSEGNPTVWKFAAELEALGATHICDICIASARGINDGNKIYRLGNTAVALGQLKTTETLFFFPPEPVMILRTRFADGRQHATFNRPIYRKHWRPGLASRCVLEKSGPAEVLNLHTAEVNRLIDSGAVPTQPPQTPEEVLNEMRTDHEEAREIWRAHPYSWGDALHDAFKVCRREYL